MSKTASRPRPAHESALDGPAGEVLRLQTLAGNSAVNALMRSRALQRDGRPAPAPKAGEKPKKSYATVTVTGDEKIGSFGVDSVNYGQSSPSGLGGGGSGSRDRDKDKKPGQITVTRTVDEKTPLLYQWAVTGEPFPTVKIALGDSLKYELTDVMISSYTTSSGSDTPTESITFNYTDIKFEHKEAGAKGTDYEEGEKK